MTVELTRRTEIALKAIRDAYGTEAGEYNVTLFVSHHLQELDPEYWDKHVGSHIPSPDQVLGMLVVSPYWDADDGLDTIDFTLPGNVTDYLLCVNFDESGEVLGIEMES